METPEQTPATHGGFYVERADGVAVPIPPTVELAGAPAVTDYVASYGMPAPAPALDAQPPAIPAAAQEE